MTLKINIICGEADHGWIYSEFIKHFKRYSKHNIVVNTDGSGCDIVHFIPYYEYFKSDKKCTAWFSHMENKKPLKEKFISVAKSVDIGISQSKKYTEILKNDYSCNNIRTIITGVDTNIFTMRPITRTGGKKMIVGYVGRAYSSSDRKNPTLLKQISQLPFVDFRSTDGKLLAQDVPSFIHGCDIIVSPSLYEGGPLSIQQSLSCGTPIMCFSDVGVAQEFSTGVIKVNPKDKVDNFLYRLEVLWKTGAYIQYRHRGIMNQMRNQVRYQSWAGFVSCHDCVWESLV